MKKLFLKLSGIFLATAVFLTGCASSNDIGNKDDGKIKGVASFYPMYDFTKLIGGDKVDVKTLIPSNVEPHDWEPSPQDIVEIGKANIFVYNGAGMENWVNKVKQNIDNKNLVYVEASKGVKLLTGAEEEHDSKEEKSNKEYKHEDNKTEYNNEKKHEHSHGQFDPHVWLNPENVKIEMKNIMQALIKVDPKNKDYYEKNYEENSKKLSALNEKYKTELSKTKRKDIIVAHQAFGYLCQAYGLNQIAIEGLSPDSEPDASRMAEITKFARKHKIKYIFFEELVSPKVAETIASEIGAKIEVLNPIEGLTKRQIDLGENYYTVMEKNLKILLKALNS